MSNYRILDTHENPAPLRSGRKSGRKKKSMISSKIDYSNNRCNIERTEGQPGDKTT